MSTKNLLIAVLVTIIFSQVLTCFSNASTNDFSNKNSSKIEVNSVAHTVELLEGGLIVINDTVTVSANESILGEFRLGFPYDYAPYLVKCFATANNRDVTKHLTLDCGLGVSGFYGVSLDLTSIGEFNSSSKNFTVTFIFSGPLVLGMNSLSLNFTLFPSLPIDANICNTTIIVPENLNFLRASFTYNETKTEGEKRYFFLNVSPLKKFAYNEAKAWLYLEVSETFVYAEIEKLERKIEIDAHGNINVRDNFLILNKGVVSLDEITLFFPKEGCKDSFMIEDVTGISKLEQGDLISNVLPIPRTLPNEKNAFSLVYKLNSTALSKIDNKIQLNMLVSKITPLLIKRLAITFIASQGVIFETTSETWASASSIKREFSRDIITFTLDNFTIFDRFQATVTYKTNILWASYPYTLIALVSSAILLLGVFAWRKPAPTAPVTVPKVTVSPRIFRKFVESYEERIKIMSRIERLEEQARRGKVPRRQYKVRKTMLENKLSSLSKELVDLRETIRRAGPRYADIIRQLEIAEAQLEEAEAGVRRVRSRYRRGEISREAYRRLLEEHEKRIDEANLKIEGALLRLKEEYS